MKKPNLSTAAPSFKAEPSYLTTLFPFFMSLNNLNNLVILINL